MYCISFSVFHRMYYLIAMILVIIFIEKINKHLIDDVTNETSNRHIFQNYVCVLCQSCSTIYVHI